MVMVGQMQIVKLVCDIFVKQAVDDVRRAQVNLVQ